MSTERSANTTKPFVECRRSPRRIAIWGSAGRPGKLDEAITHSRRRSGRNQSSSTRTNNLGVALSSQGKLDEAIAQFTEAIRLNPNYANAHAGLALALQRQGRIADAAREFRNVLRIRRATPTRSARCSNWGRVPIDRESIKEAAQIVASTRALAQRAEGHCAASTQLR
jgi:tetratricopeptide (TPR) repeat protein